MRTALLAFTITCAGIAAAAQDLVPPEVVRLENLKVDGDTRAVYVGNGTRHWVLSCNLKTDGCIAPAPDRKYLLFDAKTRWKMPGAKTSITLSFVQDWTVKYNQGENIGLVPEDGEGGPSALGIFILDRSGGGYEQETVFSDGPITYGTGLSEKDRQSAWKQLFFMMVKAATEQQGKDALGVKVARRCLPNQDSCITALDAMLVGIGGIQEPRKVLVVVATDVHDQNKQLGRMVCTWPAKDKQVCRDWDTGKLVTGDMPPAHN